MTCYEILNVEKKVTRQQLEKARDSMLAKLKHGVIEQEWQDATELEGIVNKAYELLADNKDRITEASPLMDIFVSENLRNKLWNLSNLYYCVDTLNFRHESQLKMPKCCVCCASEDVTGYFKTKLMRGEYRIAAHTMHLKFPLCSDCSRHIRQTRVMYYLITVLPAVIATIIATFLRISADHDMQVIINMVWLPAIAGALFLLMALAACFKPASLNHAAHRFPAKIIDFNMDVTSCGFYNRQFAEKFTVVNGGRLLSRVRKKAPYASRFLIGYEKPGIAVLAMYGWTFLGLYISLGIVPYKQKENWV